MKTKLFMMMSAIVAFVVMLPTAANAENPAGEPAPLIVNLPCSTSNASVTKKLGKFEHKAFVSITTGDFWVSAGTLIKFSVNGHPPKTFKVGGELGIPPFTKKSLGMYLILLDEKEPWPDGCSASYTNP